MSPVRETRIPCPRCEVMYRTRYPGWVCEHCEADATTEALAVIASRLTRAVGARSICRYDGCLLIGSGTCPACRVRLERHEAKNRRPGHIDWVRKPNGILVRKKVA